MTPMKCPNNCDLIGDPIPEEHREYYDGNATHFSRAIGIYDWNRDMTTSWSCPDCRVVWDRFNGGTIPEDQEGNILPGLSDLLKRPSPFEE